MQLVQFNYRLKFKTYGCLHVDWLQFMRLCTHSPTPSPPESTHAIYTPLIDTSYHIQAYCIKQLNQYIIHNAHDVHSMNINLIIPLLTYCSTFRPSTLVHFSVSPYVFLSLLLMWFLSCWFSNGVHLSRCVFWFRWSPLKQIESHRA